MRLIDPRSLSFTLAVALAALACDLGGERKNHDPELVTLCSAAYRAEYCFGDPGGDYDAYIDGCIEIRVPQADAVSEECGKQFRGLMACLDERNCHDELLDWFDNRLKDGDYVCHAETASFREVCPGVWFAPD